MHELLWFVRNWEYQSQVAVISNHYYPPKFLLSPKILWHKLVAPDTGGDDAVQVLVRPKSERALSPGNSATPEVTNSEYKRGKDL